MACSSYLHLKFSSPSLSITSSTSSINSESKNVRFLSSSNGSEFIQCNQMLNTVKLNNTLKCRKGNRSMVTRMVLPTAVTVDGVDTATSPIWSARSVKSFSMAELEARKLKYPTTGTEALLMGILTEGTSKSAVYLRSLGVTLFKVRDETVKLLGKADMFFFSPEHPPLTEPAQQALDWAIAEHKKRGVDGEISTELMLLGLWVQKESAAHQILAALGFNDDNAAEVSAI